MKPLRWFAAAAAALLTGSLVQIADPSPAVAADGASASSGKARKGTRVKGYTARRGGYSYDQFDTINTYGDSRGRYGSSLSLRDPQFDRQTESGPFDHGFFFDSGVGRNGGEAPYPR
jgi:hypothetical protein